MVECLVLSLLINLRDGCDEYALLSSLRELADEM